MGSYFRLITWLACALILIGCGDSEVSGQQAGQNAQNRQGPHIRLEELVGGLDRPVYLTHDGSTDRLFIVEQAGRIRLVKNGVMEVAPYLSIWRKVISQGECGLLSVAFHPQFATNGLFYVNYTTRTPKLISVISEFRADPTADKVDTSTERALLTINQPFPNHNGGQMAFGKDGMLYICMGDGGSAADPYNNAQNPQSLLGKMLRIDVKPSETAAYTIPKDNPFVNDPNYLPEIYALGLRNAWRFSFDRQTGLLWAADVGQDLWEEIDIIEKGGNYGWRIREAMHDFRPIADPPKMIDPIYEYPHTKGLSITGGFVYRGNKIPSLVGWYVYGDYSSQVIWGLKYENGKITGEAELLRSRTQPAGFGEDLSGEMYLCDHNGRVYRIVGD